jgi:hypothetical protein
MIIDKQQIGDWGEINGIRLLKENGFENIIDLNAVVHNFPVFDLLAKKQGEWYAFSSKTRNKYNPGDGKLNRQYNILVKKKSKYKLDRASRLLLEKFGIKKYHKYWIACPIDYDKPEQVFYIGNLELIPSWKKLISEDVYVGIKMSEEAIADHLILGKTRLIQEN